MNTTDHSFNKLIGRLVVYIWAKLHLFVLYSMLYMFPCTCKLEISTFYEWIKMNSTVIGCNFQISSNSTIFDLSGIMQLREGCQGPTLFGMSRFLPFPSYDATVRSKIISYRNRIQFVVNPLSFLANTPFKVETQTQTVNWIIRFEEFRVFIKVSFLLSNSVFIVERWWALSPLQ